MFFNIQDSDNDFAMRRRFEGLNKSLKERSEKQIDARCEEFFNSGSLRHPTREITIPPTVDANEEFQLFRIPDIDFFRMKVNMQLLEKIIGGLGGNFFYYHFWF